MEKEQFKALLARYASGAASSREDELIRKLLDDYEHHANKPQLSETEKEEVRQRMLANLMDHARYAPQRSLFSRIYKWTAAAVILIAAGAILLLYSTQQKPAATLTAKRQSQSKLKAGGNKAYLKLSDGSVVALNNLDNGLVAQQGETSITKTADGKLQYLTDHHSNSAAAVYNTISTPNGGTYQLTLPDGTRVWLNATSSLTFPTRFDSKRRYVKLVGEAYFEVAKKFTGKNRLPFIVDAGLSQVEVLGTHFNVSTYADHDEQQTTLLEGAVIVKRGEKQVRIFPGQQAVLNIKEGQIYVQQANLDAVMAWKEGLFSFDNTDISIAMKEIARWYNAKVIYKGEMPVTAFTGVLPRNSDINSVLELLESTHAVKCYLSGSTIIIEKTNN